MHNQKLQQMKEYLKKELAEVLPIVQIGLSMVQQIHIVH